MLHVLILLLQWHPSNFFVLGQGPASGSIAWGQQTPVDEAHRTRGWDGGPKFAKAVRVRNRHVLSESHPGVYMSRKIFAPSSSNRLGFFCWLVRQICHDKFVYCALCMRTSLIANLVHYSVLANWQSSTITMQSEASARWRPPKIWLKLWLFFIKRHSFLI